MYTEYFFQIESFLTLGFAKDPTLWKEHLCPKGAVEKWASEGRTTEPLFNNEVGYTCIPRSRILISFQKTAIEALCRDIQEGRIRLSIKLVQGIR